MSQGLEEHISTADLAYPSKTNAVVPTNVSTKPANGELSGPLLPGDYTGELRTRWDQIQSGFVDEPRTAVQHADELVAQAIKRLAETFADARAGLEHQWDKGDEASTEDLRLAFRKYRSFFDRLLTV